MLKKEDAAGQRGDKHMKTLLKIIAKLVLVVILAAGLLVGFLTLSEYRPADAESLSVTGDAVSPARKGKEITLLSWNTGYGALGDNADFFMDGGTMVKSATEERVRENLRGILSAAKAYRCDIYLLQETDVDSSRSYHIDETEYFRSGFEGYDSAFAYNYKVSFVPYPIPPLGKVGSGVMTLSEFDISEASRLQLPLSFSWPVRTANLKRCLLVSRIPVEGSDKELVVINFHLEAYDSGEGKIAQTKMLRSVLKEEYAKGNYVIAGGDMNQILSSVDASLFPVQEGMWAPGVIDVDELPNGWQHLMDSSHPSCRSLDKPYEGADKESFQYYLIDGFIVSPHVRVLSVSTEELDFKYSDHEPVLVRFILE